jgi:para-aminobenzoate synthetase component 1
MPKEQFYLYPNIMVTNALMGAVKVLSIDKNKIEHEKEVCSMINEQLFNV